MELKLRSSDLSEAETSVKAEFGIATNSLKDRFTVSTNVDWKTSRGSERSLKNRKLWLSDPRDHTIR